MWSAIDWKWVPYGMNCTVGDKIEVSVDFNEGEMSYKVNDEELGVAFRSAWLIKEDLLYAYVYMSKDAYTGKLEVEVL